MLSSTVMRQPLPPVSHCQHTCPLGQHAGGSKGRVGMMQGSHSDLATSGRMTLRRTTAAAGSTVQHSSAGAPQTAPVQPTQVPPHSPHAVLLGFDVDSCGQGLQKAMPTWPPLLYHPTGHREHVLMSALLP